MRTAMAGLLALLPGCAALAPRPVSTAQRLAAFPTAGLPVERPVTIRWNAQSVPFIEAETDGDAAFALGLVHAHLREGQMALLKRVVQGRISEMAGPFTRDIDQALRTIDFGAAAAASERLMPAETHAWVQRFVDGLNWYQDHVGATPPEYGLLGVARERWTVRDVLAGGRVAGTDINWLTYFGLLRSRGTPAWTEDWRRALAAGSAQAASFGPGQQAEILRDLLTGMGDSGSNSVVVAPSRSATGGALLAADPHLGQTLPNFWLLVGIRSPSFQVVGLMPPGLPVVALGRTPWMAWGGTNMRAAQSDLYDVSGETPGSIESRTERIRARFWGSRDVVVRRSRLGPVVSDAAAIPHPPGSTIALRWVGQEPSDEVTAFLNVMRARTPEAFRAAFVPYAVNGQNMQFATAPSAAGPGQIGQVMAGWLPVRPRMTPPDLVLDPADPASQWQGVRNATELPWAVDPPEGFIASANNPPVQGLDTPVGYFFNDPERVQRLQAILRANGHVTQADLERLQEDTVSTASLRLRDALVAALGAAGTDAAGTAPHPDFVAGLRAWDGNYAADARGPVLFETLLYHVARLLYAPAGGDAIPAQRAQWNELTRFLPGDLDARPAAERSRLLAAALDQAAEDAARFPDWGSMHRMRVAGLLASLPVIGRFFVWDDYPVAGSRETVFKTAHGLVHGRHNATYGSQARFVADLSDPDANRFVLFGGQDGWLGSANFADQIRLWREQRYLRLPLRPETVAAEFPTAMRLEPGRAGVAR